MPPQRGDIRILAKASHPQPVLNAEFRFPVYSLIALTLRSFTTFPENLQQQLMYVTNTRSLFQSTEDL
jgi:hypothetical protein